MRNACVIAAGLLGVAAANLCAAEETWRWIEAEQAVASNLGVKHPFAPFTDEERAKLSGGAWIGASGPRRSPLFAVYDVDVPADGTYTLYARKFWKHGPYRVSFNNGPWTDVGDDVALLDNVELRQHVVANWTTAGRFELKRGANRFRIESTTGDGAIAFDCFLLTSGPFAPRGTLKPGTAMSSNRPGWFAWDPAPDVADSPIDLRSLNEPQAGSKGRIVARDSRFLHETTSEPVRFWGVNVGPDVLRLGEAELDKLARMLASRGVNLIRLHGPIYKVEGEGVGSIDERQLVNVQRAVGIFKRHGIYSTLSIYFPVWMKLDAKHGWPGYQGQNPFALLFVDPKFQAVYRTWWRELLTRPNPSSGMPLKDDPALLSLEIQNEDSLFFWTFSPYKAVPAPVAEQFERRFATWLTARYGSAQAALARWKAERIEGDEPNDGRVGIAILWRLINVRDQRSKDTTRFLFELQRDFYAQTRDYLRNDLGARSLISASNWMTASDQYLTPLERASNLTGDFIDRHAYYNGIHEGPRAGWSISVGDRYSDRSALRFDPEKPDMTRPNSWNPMFDTTYNDQPTMISEIDWIEPNRFRTEMPLLCAAYGAQQDMDAITFFAAAGPGWQATLQKFSLLTPVSLAQYPAAALIYRQGLVDEGPVISDTRLRLEDMLNLEGAPGGADSKAKLVGLTRATIGDAPTSRPSVDLTPYHDADAKSIRSATGQLRLDYGKGVLTIDAPRAKAIVGFLKSAGEVSLGDVKLRSPMAYGAIAVVSLDGQPIHLSKKLLVQAMSEQQNTNWKTSGEPVKLIESFGVAPLLVKNLEGAVTVPGAWQVQALGQNGAPATQPTRVEGTLALQPTVTHYLLTR